MNNRYICKAKRKDNGEWVTGYYVFRRKRSGIFGQIISELDFDRHLIIDLRGNSHEVIPETVKQYTGLTDKNGKRIFEGDIVYCKSRLDNANMVVIFECGQFRMVLSENYRSYQTNSGFYDINCFDKEVIGNIHDNPELLKGE